MARHPLARFAPLALAAALSVVFAAARPARAQEVVRAYGPGGPAPAMKEAAEAFGKARGARVEVTAGPTDRWLAQARADADVVYSGAEYMMTDLVRAMEGRIAEDTIDTLYLRPSAILVRPGNPRRISDLPDLLKPGVKVLVVQGAGQTGMWEDMAGREGDVRMVRALRRNIVEHAPNTAAAREHWIQHPEVDAWIVYNIWQVANPGIAELVPVSEKFVIYRSSGVALTRTGADRPLARDFADFLRSKDGAAIFRKWGWLAP
jgi:accessory colonization factor AcfC